MLEPKEEELKNKRHGELSLLIALGNATSEDIKEHKELSDELLNEYTCGFAEYTPPLLKEEMEKLEKISVMLKNKINELNDGKQK